MSELRRIEQRYGAMRRTKDGGLYVPKGWSAFVMAPELRARVIRPRGGLNASVDLGVVSRKVITTVGVNFLATAFINTVEPEVINFHDSGTGAGAEAVGNTTITAAGPSRVSGTQSNPSANVYRSVATISYTGTLAITEHGLFTASTSGTLWDRSLFSAINVVNGDSIQFTYDLTLTAGG